MSADKIRNLLALALVAKSEREFGVTNLIATYIARLILQHQVCARDVRMTLYTGDPIGEYDGQSYFDGLVIETPSASGHYRYDAVLVPLLCLPPVVAIDIAKWGASCPARNNHWDDSYNKDWKVPSYEFYPNPGRTWHSSHTEILVPETRCDWEGTILPPADEYISGDPDWDEMIDGDRDQRMGQMVRHLVALVSDEPAGWRIFCESTRRLDQVADLGDARSAELRAQNFRARSFLEPLIS